MSSNSFRDVSNRPPHIIEAKEQHKATLIFFHGLGDQGDGWSSIFSQEMRISYFKYIIPNAASRPVTLNLGMNMPAWYNLLGLSVDGPEDDAGIKEAAKYAHSLIDAEIAAGIPSSRIVLGGFSMGAALAIYAGLTYGKPLGCIVSFSGFLLQRKELNALISANRQIPIFMGHGKQDSLLPLTIGRMSEQVLKTINPNVQLTEYQTDHSTTKQEHEDSVSFIQKHVSKN